MPSLPVQNVDGQVTHDTPAAPEEQTILERVNQDKAPAEKTVATPAPVATAPQNPAPAFPAPAPDVPPASFDTAEQGALKKTIPLQPGQIGLDKAQSDPIVAAVMEQLKDKEGWRVQIKSFATPHGAGVSSDRRIALARALSLRSTLITQGVPASAIDVLAEGLQSDAPAAPDRIDLYLYGPKT